MGGDVTAATFDPVRGALTVEQASAVFDVLVEAAGASEWQRDEFVFTQTHGRCDEFRFIGNLGFGGKFWRSNNRWYVTAYPEDIAAQPGRQVVIDAANSRLVELLDREWRMDG